MKGVFVAILVVLTVGTAMFGQTPLTHDLAGRWICNSNPMSKRYEMIVTMNPETQFAHIVELIYIDGLNEPPLTAASVGYFIPPDMFVVIEAIGGAGATQISFFRLREDGALEMFADIIAWEESRYEFRSHSGDWVYWRE